MELAVKTVKWFRKKRTDYLMPIGKFLVKLRIKPTFVTILAFVFGLLAVYFLFKNHVYFIVFGILHLILDGLDGVVARASKETRFGAHLDNLSDRLVLVLILGKSYFYFNETFIMAVLWIYILHHLIFVLSDLKGQVSYSRMATFIIYFFEFYTLGYFLVGILSLYGLVKQFNTFTKKKFTT